MRIRAVLKDIKSMRIHGAREIAVAALKELKKIAKEEGFGKEFNKACRTFLCVRPTAVALHNAIQLIKKEKSIDAIDKMIYYFENIGEVIGFQNYKIIKNGSTLLTHCYSGSVVDFLKVAKKKGRKFKVIVTETRPMWQGKDTARELTTAGIPVVYIVDSAAGYFVKDVDAMVFGFDSLRREGVVNKIGTYMLAVLAKENKIPVYFIGGLLKLDKRKKFKIEERKPSEVIRKRETKKFDVRNPQFDITNWRYVTAVVTERGILKPVQIKRKLRR